MTEPEDDRGDGRDPLDEDAAWAQIVAGYGKEPADPPGVWPPGDAHERKDPYEKGAGEHPEPDGGTITRPQPADTGEDDEGALRSFTVYAAGTGPRDWQPADPSVDEDDEDDEGHFVPPEPPPLPRGDTTTRFAWIAVLGGPLLLVVTVLLQQEVTWWITTLGVGGFLGGFATLVSRMRDDREDDGFDDPGRGAVV